ncbi:hypothetical protein BBP40_007099 [Aspergillus hancockii]|nr:hypothetical protein BBP40_007099 [Aspergillus hancockii]
MSVNWPSRSTDDDIKATKIPSERASVSEQHPIDRRLKSLKEDVLPLYPFLLTVPTDVPFRLGSRFVNNWAVGNDGPFTPEEHQLQYMTFLTHHEGDSLLVAVGDWSDGTGNVMSGQRPGLHSAASTPWSGSGKKKISLNDYKNKRKTSASPLPIGQDAHSRDASAVRVLDDNQRASKASFTGDNPHKLLDKFPSSQTSTRSDSETLERKRLPESEPEHSNLQERKGSEIGFLKRPKLSPEGAAEPNISERSKPNGLPTLLSPTLPPTSNDRPTNPEKFAKPQLLMKLKYGRANRKRVEALLKFSGKRKVAPPNSPVKNTADSDSLPNKKTNENSNKTSASDNSSSRLYRSDGKPKHLPSSQGPRVAGLEKPRTPLSSVPTVAAYVQEKAKGASFMPAKDLKDLSYHPETAGNDGRASSQPTVRYPPGDTTTAVKQALSQVNDQPSASRSGERRAWKGEYQKHGNLGRELKHAAERHTTRESGNDSDGKLAAATAIEAILCFILAFVADDQSKSLSRQVGDSSAWLSILAYWRVVKKNSASFPRLNSLCLILGATSYDAIHALDLERLAVTPLPGEQTPVPTPGSDGNAVLSDENKKHRKEILELKSRLPECYKESQRLWLEGSQGLSEDILVSEFPETWSKRSKNFSEQGKQQLKPGDYSGEFFLPLGRITTPVEIVRFGYSILREWCKNEGVEWSGRLGL